MPVLLQYFIYFYAVASFFYIFYRYFFATADVEKNYKPFYPTVSIVIPSYNEEELYLKQCITSVCKADYPGKEVIVIDDGSTNNSWKVIKELRKIYKFKAFRFKENKGKRAALAKGFREANGKVVISVDSDTVIPSESSIVQLIRPFQDHRIGAVSGNVRVKNRGKNLITRIMDSRYWLAFELEKSGQNPYSSVTCCAGPFAAYRKIYLTRFLDAWENQKFLGVRCTYGDDRGLTTFMLKHGFRTKFMKKALAYTYSPESLKKLLNQQIRWKKSFTRESWSLAHFLHKRSVFMNIEFYLFWLTFFCGFAAKFLAFYFLFLFPEYIFYYVLTIAFAAMLHYIYAFVRSPGMKGVYGIFYGLFYEFVLSWLFFIALINLRDFGWGTR